MLGRVNYSTGVQLCVTVYGKLIDEDKWYRFAGGGILFEVIAC